MENPNTILVIFGCILLGSGILGGGFEIKEFKLPVLPMVPRFVSAVAGASIVAFGLFHSTNSISTPSPRVPQYSLSSQPQSIALDTITFVVSDELNNMQIREDVTVAIDGRDVGHFSLDESTRTVRKSISVQKHDNGKYEFKVTGMAQENDPDDPNGECPSLC